MEFLLELLQVFCVFYFTRRRLLLRFYPPFLLKTGLPSYINEKSISSDCKLKDFVLISQKQNINCFQNEE